MTLESLIYFLEICKYGSISKAAENLHFSPQAISKSMKHLENDFGTQLLIRGKNGVTLTEAGVLFKSSAENILNELARFQEKIAPLKNSKQDSDKLTTILILCTNTFTPLVNSYYQNLLFKYPSAALTLFATEPMITTLPENFDDYDISIVCMPSQFELLKTKKQTHDIYILDQDNLRLYLSKKSLYATNRIISNKTLSEIPLLDYSINNQESSLMTILREHHISPNISVRSNVPIQVIGGKIPENHHFLATKFYITTFLRNIPDNLISIPLRTKISLSYVLIIKKPSLTSPIIKEFVEIIKQNFKYNIIKL